MSVCLCERLTFDKLFRISEPKRVYRSFTVKGPPLEIDSYQDAVYYIFNFKANPSTTGLRHRGYVKFFKPKNKNPKNVPLQHLECLVDCTCPDFRYRWAWTNKQRQSSVVGGNSLNQAWNRAPKITNPKGKPGLCKHILATRQYLYGMLSSFEGDEPDTAYKLDRLTKYATKRWTDFEGQMRAAKAKEAELRRRREQRNLGQLPVAPPQAPQPVRKGPKPASVNAPGRMPKEQQPKSTADLKNIKPEPLPQPELAKPPGQRGRGMPPAAPTPTSTKKPYTWTGPKKPGPPRQAARTAIPKGMAAGPYTWIQQKPISKPKRVIGNRVVKPMQPGAYGWVRPEEAYLCRPLRDLILESVVNANGDNMSNIKEAIKLVEEMEADELSQLGSGAPPLDDIGGETLEPSEPPVSDSAVGADTEGDTALSLLRKMSISLEQIAAAVAPVEELPPGAGGMGGPGGPLVGPEGVEGMPMPDEPPSDIEDEGGPPEGEPHDEGEPHEEEDETEADEEKERKKSHEVE